MSFAVGARRLRRGWRGGAVFDPAASSGLLEASSAPAGDDGIGRDYSSKIAQRVASWQAGSADAVAELGIHQLADELDDVARGGCELAVLPGAADFIEQHFIDIALDVLAGMAAVLRIPLDPTKMSSMVRIAP